MSQQEIQLWQQDNHPIQLSRLNIARQKLDYPHYNPVVSGIVGKPEDYLYRSTRNYMGMKGLVDVSLLDPRAMVKTKYTPLRTSFPAKYFLNTSS